MLHGPEPGTRHPKPRPSQVTTPQPAPSNPLSLRLNPTSPNPETPTEKVSHSATNTPFYYLHPILLQLQQLPCVSGRHLGGAAVMQVQPADHFSTGKMCSRRVPGITIIDAYHQHTWHHPVVFCQSLS
jgi:hypothetical protein